MPQRQVMIPLQVLSGCVAAARKLMDRQGLTTADVDLFELHEAFAATVIMCRQELDIPADKLKYEWRGDCPRTSDGATGAIMAGTLLDELERRGKQGNRRGQQRMPAQAAPCCWNAFSQDDLRWSRSPIIASGAAASAPSNHLDRGERA